MTGTFIAFVGLPGAGKSTVCQALADRMGGLALLEPEDWPAVVTDPSSAGGFTALTWFRAMRVPLYYQAVRERQQGRAVVLDTYYDKICHHLLGADGMDWFLSPGDPYFDLYKEIAERDWELLPTADVIVSFQLQEDTWRHFLDRRGRSFDDDWGVSEGFHAQRHFAAAAQALSDAFAVPVIPFKQDISSPDDAAERLLIMLQDAKLIN